MRKRVKILSYFTVVVLTLTMLIGSTNAVQAAPSSDIALAQQAGQSFIAQRTQIFPDWASASLSNPQTYYNLQGQINAYLFTIAMISEYYKQIFGYSALDNWPLDEENLYTDMQTNQRWPNGTWPGYGGSGFVFYAALRDYTFSTSYDMPTYYEYTTIQYYINAIHPILILFDASAPYAQWHWCAIKGYQGGSNVNYLIVNNPWGNQDYVSWEANFSYVWITYLSPS